MKTIPRIRAEYFVTVWLALLLAPNHLRFSPFFEGASAALILFSFLMLLRGALRSLRKAAAPGFYAGGAGGNSSPVSGAGFDSVAANARARKSLQELSDFLKNPEKYARLGARIPRGILLYGPPGTGKTLLARALAGEASVPFLAMSGSDFVEMYAGVGAKRVREVFQRARKLKKCVVFIDEIDALGASRGVNSSDERDQTLNQLLSEMSGFHPSDGVIVIAATNRIEILDSALLRPGRFDRKIEVGMPHREERESILRLHAENKPLSETVNLSALAAQTAYFSGASLENLLNEAAIRAAARGSNIIENCDIDSAYLSLIAGDDVPAHKTERERTAIALHEAGHAVVLKALNPRAVIRRISILPSSGGAAGYNLTLPDEKSLFSKKELSEKIAVLMGGRAAEEIAFGEDGITTGASNDLRRAAEMAAGMAMELGMGVHPAVCESALRSSGGGQDAQSAARSLLTQGYERAKHILVSSHEALSALANALLESESLTQEEIDRFFESGNPDVSNENASSAEFGQVS